MADAWVEVTGLPRYEGIPAAPDVEELPRLTRLFLNHHAIAPLCRKTADVIQVVAARPASDYAFKTIEYATGASMQVLIGLVSEVERLNEIGYREGRSALDEATLSVEVRSESGKLDLNFCSPDNFLKLLRWAGAAPKASEVWVSQLESLYAGGKRLIQLEELLDFEGASLEVFERIRPMITVWSGKVLPDAGLASEPLRKALGLKAAIGTSMNLRAALEIRTEARLISGETETISAIMLINPDNASGKLYRILTWRRE